MEANYKKGEIFYLNEFGTVLLEDDNTARVGIIIAGPSNYLVEDEEGNEEDQATKISDLVKKISELKPCKG